MKRSTHGCLCRWSPSLFAYSRSLQCTYNCARFAYDSDVRRKARIIRFCAFLLFGPPPRVTEQIVSRRLLRSPSSFCLPARTFGTSDDALPFYCWVGFLPRRPHMNDAFPLPNAHLLRLSRRRGRRSWTG
ncbi:unnamed protein product [Phaeothamnion confervicola]